MDYGFPIYVDRNKTRKKVCWLQIIAGIIIWGLSQCCQIKPVLRSWSASGFILHSFSLSNSF